MKRWQVAVAGVCFVLALLAFGQFLDRCANAQELSAVRLDVLPSEGKAAAVVTTEVEGRWIVLTDQMSPVLVSARKLAAGGSQVTWEGDPGDVFAVLFIPNDLAEGIGVSRVVLGPRGPPPDDDDPDDDPTADTEGPVHAIVMRVATDLIADQSAVLLDLRTAADGDDQLLMTVYPPDAEGPDGKPVATVKAYVDMVPGAAKLPFLFLVRKKTNSDVFAVLWKGELPDSAETVMETVREVVR